MSEEEATTEAVAAVVNDSLTAQAQAKKAHIWKRDELDWYVEPMVATTALGHVEKFHGAIADPCCGQGNIVTALLRLGYNVRGSDVVRRVGGQCHWFYREADFLTDNKYFYRDYPNIVMNPPFFRGKGAEAFIRRALEVAQGKVACFVDIRFLTGDERAGGLYFESAPHRIWILTPRVSCPPGEYLAAGNKAGNGSADWCWLVWDNTAPPAAFSETRWLRWKGFENESH